MLGHFLISDANLSSSSSASSPSCRCFFRICAIFLRKVFRRDQQTEESVKDWALKKFSAVQFSINGL